MTDKTHGPLERETCSRCGGSGRYSWCQRFGSVCFGCAGKGVVLTKRGHAAMAYLTELLSVPAGSLRVGDSYRATSITMGCEPFSYWAKVTEVTVDGDRVHLISTSRYGGLDEVRLASEKVRKAETTEEKKVALEKAVAFQGTLAASGKPIRLKKDGTPYAARKPRAPKVKAVEPTVETKPTKPGKVITAKYGGVCRDCGATFEAGTTILWSRDHGTTCVECPKAEAAEPVAPVEQDPEARVEAMERDADEREYQAGIADTERYHENRDLLGSDIADAIEIEREMREGA